MSVAGEVLAQVAQQGIDVWHAGPIGAFVEEEVLRWLCDLVGYGEGSFGILTSGGVMANFIAMALVRDVHLPPSAGWTARLAAAPSRGSGSTPRTRRTSRSAGRSTSSGSHRRRSVVPAADDFRLRGAPVEEAIAGDRAAGLLPIAIAAVAGSTNTGAVDAVGELADLAIAKACGCTSTPRTARRRDSPPGTRVVFRTWSGRSPSRSTPTSGSFRRMTSVGSWFATELPRRGLRRTAAGVLPRGPREARDGRPRGARATTTTARDQLNFWRLGFEGTRRWRALKLWLSWKHVGIRGLRAAGRGEQRPRRPPRGAHRVRRLRGPARRPPLSVVCFRHLPGGRRAPGAGRVELDAHQDRLQAALEASGEGWLTTTRLRGATYLRAGILNTQSTVDDIDDLLDLLRRLAH